MSKKKTLIKTDTVSSDSAPKLDIPKTPIETVLADLLYPSESDEPIEWVTCYLGQPEPLTVSQIKDWLMLPPSVFVEEKDEAFFWEPVTTRHEWYDMAETERTDRFIQLQTQLSQQLSQRQVFCVGDVEIDVYVLGIEAATGKRAGLKTRIIQT